MEEREKRVEREAALGHDGEWKEVINKKRMRQKQRMGKIDIATNGKWSNHQCTISFYFSEIPDSHGARDMLKAFSYYGDAMEVVITPKRDKRGRRFGFVRFSNVSDPRLFAVKLDNIIIGSNKIHVNILRYNREWNERNPKNQAPFQKRQVVQSKVQTVWKKKEGGTGAAGKEEQAQSKVVKKVQFSNNPLPPKIVYHRKIDLSEVCYTVDEDKMQKFNQMFIGVVKTPGSTYSVQEWFSTNGVFSI